MPYVGREVKVRDREACNADYSIARQTAKYVQAQNAFQAPTAKAYVRKLFQEAPEAREAVRGKLAVVTGVALDGTGYHIAKELALQAGMHVVIMGKSEGNLKKCITGIRKESQKRKIWWEAPEATRLYKCKHDLSSLDSCQQAAGYVAQLANEKYNRELYVLINNGAVGSNEAELTDEGIEYNTGCNFIGTHYFTQLLTPLLHAASDDDSFKPRLVMGTSMGHAFGWNFDPDRLLEYPKQGGAPKGFIVEKIDGTIREFEPELIGRSVGASIVAAVMAGGGITESEAMQAVEKSGTHVGRSKMAIVADTIHLAKQYPELNVTCYHPGSIAWNGNVSFTTHGLNMFQYFSPSQGACAALRAALDPDMNTEADLQGAYLHADGNPWVPAQPTAKDPVTKQPYSMDKYAKLCYEAAEELIDRMLKAGSYEPPSIEN